MRIADLRLSSQDEADLKWFWTEADGDLGLKSMFPQQMAQLQIGNGARGTHTPKQLEPDGRLVEAATRARLVSRALETCRPEHVRILRAAYCESVFRPIRVLYGELAELVTRTDAARQAYRRSRTTRSLEEWLTRLAARAEKGEAEPRRIVYQVRGEAEARLVAACRAYVGARRRWVDINRQRWQREAA